MTENPYKFIASVSFILFTSSIAYTDQLELSIYKKQMEWEIETSEKGYEIKKMHPDASEVCNSKNVEELKLAINTQASKRHYIEKLSVFLDRASLVKKLIIGISISLFFTSTVMWIYERKRKTAQVT